MVVSRKCAFSCIEEPGLVEEGTGAVGRIPRGWQLVRRVKEDHGQVHFVPEADLVAPNSLLSPVLTQRKHEILCMQSAFCLVWPRAGILNLTRALCADAQPLFGLAFNNYDPKRRNLFATTGSNRATIYELQNDGGVQVRQVCLNISRAFQETTTTKAKIKILARETETHNMIIALLVGTLSHIFPPPNMHGLDH